MALKLNVACGPICEGVEEVKADCTANKLTVTGNVDATWLRERVEGKTKKKVDLIFPQPKKDAGAGDKKPDEKSDKKADDKKAGDKKFQEAAVSAVVMKIRLHCDGCALKIKHIILKNIDGVNSVTTDLQKDLVTVTGTMDAKELTAYLKEKLRRSVDIVPPPKKDDGGGDKKEKEGGGGDKKEGKTEGGGDKKEGDQSKAAEGSSGGGEGRKVEVNKMEYQSFNLQTYYAVPPMHYYNQNYANQDYGVQVYHHPGQVYAGHGYGYDAQYSRGPPPPPQPTYININDQMFSDENPNGCSVM